MKTYTIEQGDTLLRVAKKNGFNHVSSLYHHPCNEEFRALRPNPDIVLPGDKINIPQKADLKQVRPVNGRHSFVVKKPEQEMFRIKVQNCKGESWAGKRAKLTVDDHILDCLIAEDGLIEVPLPKLSETSAQLEIFLDAGDEPTDIIDVDLGYLDPAESETGVQARVSNLGFDCGALDGDIGEKSREAIELFQEANDLTIDGEPGPLTRKKLLEIYGC